jgi:hypothetical protein
MPETSLPIQVPSEDPKKKKGEEEEASGKKEDEQKPKTDGDSKDGEDLVSHSAFRVLLCPAY